MTTPKEWPKIYCPKCRNPVNTDMENAPIFQPLTIELKEVGALHMPLPTRYAEPYGRYCCEVCEFCFIIEAGY